MYKIPTKHDLDKDKILTIIPESMDSKKSRRDRKLRWSRQFLTLSLRRCRPLLALKPGYISFVLVRVSADLSLFDLFRRSNLVYQTFLLLTLLSNLPQAGSCGSPLKRQLRKCRYCRPTCRKEALVEVLWGGSYATAAQPSAKKFLQKPPEAAVTQVALLSPKLPQGSPCGSPLRRQWRNCRPTFCKEALAEAPWGGSCVSYATAAQPSARWFLRKSLRATVTQIMYKEGLVASGFFEFFTQGTSDGLS